MAHVTTTTTSSSAIPLSATTKVVTSKNTHQPFVESDTTQHDDDDQSNVLAVATKNNQPTKVRDDPQKASSNNPQNKFYNYENCINSILLLQCNGWTVSNYNITNSSSSCIADVTTPHMRARRKSVKRKFLQAQQQQQQQQLEQTSSSEFQQHRKRPKCSPTVADSTTEQPPPTSDAVIAGEESKSMTEAVGESVQAVSKDNKASVLVVDDDDEQQQQTKPLASSLAGTNEVAGTVVGENTTKQSVVKTTATAVEDLSTPTTTCSSSATTTIVEHDDDETEKMVLVRNDSDDNDIIVSSTKSYSRTRRRRSFPLVVTDDDNATDVGNTASTSKQPHTGVDVVLDMLAYHRGVEGDELRDVTTGELLEPCPIVTTTPTTNPFDSTTPPPTITKVTIQFPLTDNDEECDDIDELDHDDDDASKSTLTDNAFACPEKKTKPPAWLYHEVLDWDVTDPTVPSPQEFAMSLALEYGLDYEMKCMVLQQIQSQLRKFIYDTYKSSSVRAHLVNSAAAATSTGTTTIAPEVTENTLTHNHDRPATDAGIDGTTPTTTSTMVTAPSTKHQTSRIVVPYLYGDDTFHGGMEYDVRGSSCHHRSPIFLRNTSSTSTLKQHSHQQQHQQHASRRLSLASTTSASSFNHHSKKKRSSMSNSNRSVTSASATTGATRRRPTKEYYTEVKKRLLLLSKESLQKYHQFSITSAVCMDDDDIANTKMLAPEQHGHLEPSSQQTITNATSTSTSCKTMNGVMKDVEGIPVSLQTSVVCHLCRLNDQPHGYGIKFPCGHPHHALCQYHLENLLPKQNKCCTWTVFMNNGAAPTILKTTPVVTGPCHRLFVRSCFMCALACKCRSCTKCLDTVASEFYDRCTQQNTIHTDAAKADHNTLTEAIAETDFPALFQYCQQVQFAENNNSNNVAASALGLTSSSLLGQMPYEQKQEYQALQKRRKNQNLIAQRVRDFVPKLPVTDFPRETSNGLPVDSEFESNYHIVYNTGITSRTAFIGTTDGNTASAENVDPDATAASVPVIPPREDGSADYCHLCHMAGNLICCDCCPRAYHTKCIENKETTCPTHDTSSHWECPTCVKERNGTGTEFELIEGNSILPQICTLYGNSNDDTNEASSSISHDRIRVVKLLAVLYETLEFLSSYDFGFMFRNPVDIKSLPTYADIVKTPMDYRTINKKLMDGEYYNSDEHSTCIDTIPVAVLQDMELVWHNCYIFNTEGSAVYRMAQVQEKCARRIHERSCVQHMTVAMKDAVSSFADSLRKERSGACETSAIAKTNISDNTVPSNFSLSRHCRRKIVGPAGRGGQSNRRPIAVLDPDTGRVVKIYYSMLSAATVVEFLFSTGTPCEWDFSDVNKHQKLRRFVLTCRIDLRCLLFGYRWLFLDELQQGLVFFEDTSKELPLSIRQITQSLEVVNSCAIQMIDGGMSYFFNSIDEALSFSGLGSCSTVTIREKLLNLSPPSDTGDDAFTEIAGRMWRRFVYKDMNNDNGAIAGTQRDDLCVVQHATNMPDTDSGRSHTCMSLLDDVKIVKRDLVSGNRVLLGFSTQDAAFHDWLQTIDGSVFTYTGPRTKEIFLHHFLDGVQNVDGIFWQRKAITTI